jgi:hypothetical protein
MLPATTGLQQQAGKSQLQITIQDLSPDSFFLPTYLWWENNRTTPACWETYWKYTAFELGTLCGFFFLVLCDFVLFYVTPLMRQLQNNIWGTISRTGGWGTNTKIIKTETSLHLNSEVFFLSFYFFYIYIFSFIYLFFIFILIFILFFFIFSPLSVSLMPFQLTVD